MVDSTNEQTEAALRAQDERVKALALLADILVPLRAAIRQQRAGINPGDILGLLDRSLVQHGYIETKGAPWIW
jgi:hypothetical protein